MSLQTLPASNKKVYEHLLYRFGFCAAVLIFCASMIWWLLPPHGSGILPLLFMPCCFFYVLTAFNVMMFPWQYSVFGPERKTPRPTGRPIIALQALATRIGRCSVPLATWYFFLEGVAISTGIGDGWIPFTLVRRIERRGKWIVIAHNSKEVRSPIEFSTTFFATERPDPVYSFLEESMSVQIAELAVPPAEPARRDGPLADDWSKGRLFDAMCLLWRIVRVAIALALAGGAAYGCVLRYQQREFLDASFLAIFAVGCFVIAGLTILWGIPGHEWRRRDDD